MTVKEIRTLNAMNAAYVLAGSAGLDRIVAGANVMEVPDIEAFVVNEWQGQPGRRPPC